MEQHDSKDLSNGNATTKNETEVSEEKINCKVTPRFLGPPLKLEDFITENGTAEHNLSRREVKHEILEDGTSFLPLGAGGPAPPVFHQYSEERVVKIKDDSICPDTPHVKFVDGKQRFDRLPTPPRKLSDELDPSSSDLNNGILDEIIQSMQQCKIAEEHVLIQETETVQENGRMSPCGVPPAPPVIPETEALGTEILIKQGDMKTDLKNNRKISSSETNITSETKVTSPETQIKHAEINVLSSEPVTTKDIHIDSTLKPSETENVYSETKVKGSETNTLSSETKLISSETKSVRFETTNKFTDTSSSETKSVASKTKSLLAETSISSEKRVIAENERKRLEFLLGTENIEEFHQEEPEVSEAKDEGDTPTKVQDQIIKKHTVCAMKIRPAINVDIKTEEGNTPPNTPLIESTEPDNTRSMMEEYFRDPSRIPLGAGGPAPSICHPLSKDGIPAQSPTPFSRIAYGEPREILMDVETTNDLSAEKITFDVSSEQKEMNSSEFKQENLEFKSSLIIKKIQNEMMKKSEVLEENKLPVEENLIKEDEDKTPVKDEIELEPELRQKSGNEDRTKSVSVDETAMRNLRGQSLPPEVTKKPEKPARGAIARLASGDETTASAKPVGISIAAPRRSHSFIGFSSPSITSKVAGSVHAHRQQFLQRRMLFETPESFENKKSTMRKFEIELKALKLGNKSLCDSWVTEEKEDAQSSRSLQRTSLRSSFIHRRSTEKTIPETDSKETESKD